MEDFSVNEMLELQRKLQERYQDKWEPIGPATGKNKLLWMIGEIGEVIDIVKKNGGEKAVRDADLRAHLVEEMADVLMYYNDVPNTIIGDALRVKQVLTREKYEALVTFSCFGAAGGRTLPECAGEG